MNALRREIAHLSKRLEDERKRKHESPRELTRQSEAKRRQSPQSEANVCRHKCNLEKTSLINCTGHPIMQRTPTHRTSSWKSLPVVRFL